MAASHIVLTFAISAAYDVKLIVKLLFQLELSNYRKDRSQHR